MNGMFRVVLVAIIFVVVLVMLALTPKFDHKRIRKNIELYGGEVVNITRAWGVGMRYDRTYNVSYIAVDGMRMTATCVTSWDGVFWISERPPGLK